MGSVQPQIRAAWAVGTQPAWDKGSASALTSPEASHAVLLGFQHPGPSAGTESQPRTGAEAEILKLMQLWKQILICGERPWRCHIPGSARGQVGQRKFSRRMDQMFFKEVGKTTLRC